MKNESSEAGAMPFPVASQPCALNTKAFIISYTTVDRKVVASNVTSQTCNCLRLKRVLSKALAGSTDSLSANSMYANLRNAQKTFNAY